MFLVIMLKTVLTTLLLGTFSMFAYGFVGALLSYICMMAAFKVSKENISLMGISMIGGVITNLATSPIIIPVKSPIGNKNII